MGIVAGQPIRGEDHHAIEFPALRRVTQPIQSWTIEPRAADALFAIFVLG
jgi:hypothetical protein